MMVSPKKTIKYNLKKNRSKIVATSDHESSGWNASTAVLSVSNFSLFFHIIYDIFLAAITARNFFRGRAKVFDVVWNWFVFFGMVTIYDKQRKQNCWHSHSEHNDQVYRKVSRVKGSSWHFSRHDRKVYCKGEECSERIPNLLSGIRMKMKYKATK